MTTLPQCLKEAQLESGGPMLSQCRDKLVRSCNWTLYIKGAGPVTYGDYIVTNDNDLLVLVGGREPLHAASSGRIWVRPVRRMVAVGEPEEFIGEERELFPHVFNMEWRAS